MIRASHRQPGFWAALLLRLSGLALTLFLPAHFLALGTALRGAGALESFLAATRNPWVKAAELGLVIALALHIGLGFRILAIEFLPGFRERTLGTVSACIAAAFAVGLVFLLNNA